ncbi:hypothetical protein HPHPP4D_1473 [Helicobacter pylori Hp P-4d]|uniref:Uncharacterized protein n=1 Tax=Helicobacter pylori Hp P-4 TaxID=992075 RepID=I9W5L1_HELPX|nr:hypothetical protein HPHPP4_1260 [Helicobacter pylori Hp P-4]EJC22379.1 hypothetical protein HPHPP4D_1473 [Helicobacter pylori Hp P-4d]EJC23090.1 hypothetical protein HPHPP4C_1283 [Helicobacter pylori Hp P-4c]
MGFKLNPKKGYFIFIEFKKSFFKNSNKNYWRLIRTKPKFLKGFFRLIFLILIGQVWVVYCLAYSFVVGLGLSRFRGLVSFPL